jgi:hypothetical protein
MMRECWNWKSERLIQISEFRSLVITLNHTASDQICLKIEGAIFKITESVETYRKLP